MDELKQTLDGALAKLKAGMNEGPFGPDVALTATEACLVYRLLTEGKGRG